MGTALTAAQGRDTAASQQLHWYWMLVQSLLPLFQTASTFGRQDIMLCPEHLAVK